MTAQQAPATAAATPVLVGLGETAAAGPGGLPPLQRVAHLLAGRLGRVSLQLDPEIGPDPALAALAAAARDRGGNLAYLPVDVGLPLGDGRCWAEALGAWRQPCLLVVSAAQLATGLPAAGSALLGHWRVPLLGLLQWGGRWDGPLRRRDGLPWLGLLPDPEAAGRPLDETDPQAEEWQAEQQRQAELVLASALAQRWRQLALG
jgi:hypothetical protein